MQPPYKILYTAELGTYFIQFSFYMCRRVKQEYISLGLHNVKAKHTLKG